MKGAPSSRQPLCWMEYNQEDKCWSEKLPHYLNETVTVNSLEIPFWETIFLKIS